MTTLLLLPPTAVLAFWAGMVTMHRLGALPTTHKPRHAKSTPARRPGGPGFRLGKGDGLAPPAGTSTPSTPVRGLTTTLPQSTARSDVRRASRPAGPNPTTREPNISRNPQPAPADLARRTTASAAPAIPKAGAADRCSECRDPIDRSDPHADYGLCRSCLHDALRSGWEP